MIRFANFSPDGLYRWSLTRIWSDGPKALVCMCNPSFAGSDKEDPTTRRLNHLLALRGFGGYTAVNWEPLISSQPADVFEWQQTVDDTLYAKVCAENLRVIADVAAGTKQHFLAWGNHVPMNEQAQEICRIIGPQIWCFGTTINEKPIHPMARGEHRISDDWMPQLFMEISEDG